MPHGVTNVLTLFTLVALPEHVTGELAAVDPELKAVSSSHFASPQVLHPTFQQLLREPLLPAVISVLSVVVSAGAILANQLLTVAGKIGVDAIKCLQNSCMRYSQPLHLIGLV
jgi:hypothetical protein